MDCFDEGFIQAFKNKVELAPNQVIARYNGSAIDFATLDQESGGFATRLRHRGVERGDRVAVMMRNSPAALSVIFALAKAAVVWVPLNAQLRGDGLRYIIEHCEPRGIVCDEDLVGTIRDCGATIDESRFIVVGARFGLEELLDASDKTFDEAVPASDSPFAIMYTSGTTGKPKGVIVSHRMIRLAGEAVARVTTARAGDVFFVWEPLYHIGGAQLIVLPLIADVSLAMVERFSASRFWEQVRDHRTTHIHYLGGILQMLLKQPLKNLDRLHGARIAWGGGCPKEIWTAFRERFGVEIRECYGMTEASSITTCNDVGLVGSVGQPMPWFTVDILDPTGRRVSQGDKGEIVVRTNRAGALFSGYFRNDKATAKALREGALYTSDLGSFDTAGNLYFHGRMSDSVRCKGENVSAWEVEHVAAAHPAVEDCAMIGVASDISEQDIKLFVKPKAGVAIDMLALSAWLGERLAPYQNPRYLAVVSEFERTPSHRIMKHRLSTSLDDGWDRLGAASADSSKVQIRTTA